MKAKTLLSADIYSHHPLFEASTQLWNKIGGSVIVKSYDMDEQIFTHGDQAVNLWLVYNGWVKLSRQTPDGKETIIGLCTEGDVFGEASLFPNASYPYTAEVVGENAEIASLNAATFRTLIANDPAIARRIMAVLNERVAQAQLKVEHMNTMSAAQRLGCFLLRLCHSQTGGSKNLQIPVGKNILASYLGMKPETLSRSQSQLSPLGVKVSGHNVVVSDINRLREFVCESCSQSGSCEAEDNAG